VILAALSPRERAVLSKLAEGFQQKEIPETLPVKISVSAVRVYLARARLKLGARTNYQLVALFVRACPLSAKEEGECSAGAVVKIVS